MGFVLGIDNLVVGFALSFYNVPLLLTVVFIATVSIVMSLIGLELGKYLGERFEEWSEVAGSLNSDSGRAWSGLWSSVMNIPVILCQASLRHQWPVILSAAKNSPCH